MGLCTVKSVVKAVRDAFVLDEKKKKIKPKPNEKGRDKSYAATTCGWYLLPFDNTNPLCT